MHANSKHVQQMWNILCLRLMFEPTETMVKFDPKAIDGLILFE